MEEKDVRAPKRHMRRAFRTRSAFVIVKQIQEIRVQLAETLQDQLGQQLAGTLLAAGAICAQLARRHAPEARDAAYLVDLLKNANTELTCLISNLDGGKRR